MKITFSGDHEAILAEMRAFLANVTGIGTTSPAPEASEASQPEPKKRGRPKKVKDEDPEAADRQNQNIFDRAVDILKEISVNSEEKRADIRKLVEGYGIKKVAEIPLEKAGELLLAAEELRDAA